jgi:hypothetical protein
MKRAFGWIGGIGILATLLAPASAEDWATVAAETDEPAFGMRITKVLPGSQAEALGLGIGDFVYQIGERAMRGFVGWDRREEETAFFCRSGRKGTATVRPGKMGVNFVEELRPQLAYLRGEIGSSDPRWDTVAAESLALLAADHDGALRKWSEAKALGYPDDELDAFVKAFTAWRLGRPFSMREAYDAVNAEFSTMPRLYAALLEDMAYASGQIDLLAALHRIDPLSSKVSPRHLETWESIAAGPLPNRRLLDQAAKLRDRDILSELSPLDGEDAPKWEERLGKLRDHGSFSASAGRYQMTKFRLPEGVDNWHLRISCPLYVYEFHDRWNSAARLGAYSDEANGRRLGSRTLAEIDIIAERHIGTQISASAGHNAVDRKIRLLNKPIPYKGDEKEGEKSRMSRVFNIDMVRLGGEIGVYCDGVAYCHLPIDPNAPTTELNWFVSGISARIAAFEAWSLKPGHDAAN